MKYANVGSNIALKAYLSISNTWENAREETIV